MPDSPRASVVIPAHDEERVLARCLGALTGQPGIDAVEVVVVANGCTDDTAGVASRFAEDIPRLRVVELAEASKVAALNAGDAACTAFPRIYLDGDIRLSPTALASLVEVLDRPEAVVASPHVEFDTRRSSVLVRAFYDAFRHLPYVQRGLIGLGVYGVSAAGRRRFGGFPDLIADDLFVQRLFTPDERLTSDGTFSVTAPRGVRDLVKVRVRVARGNAQLEASHPEEVTDAAATSSSTLSALARLALRRPRLLPSAVVYAAVVVVARLMGRRDGDDWLRDDSSRTVSG